MTLSTRVWGAGKRLLLGGALVLTYLIFFGASMRFALKTRDVVVPSLAGKTVNDATTLLAADGLTMKVEEPKRIDPSTPAGAILLQDPSAGTRTRRERNVKVWISAGPRATLVPALVGESERTAQLRAQEDGLQLASVAEIRSNNYAADTIVAQNPGAQQTLPSGAELSVLINRVERSATYVMPDLIGVNGDRAADLLRSHGFRVTVVGDHPYPGIPGGIVLRQNPQGGFRVAPGDAISLEVSR